MKYSVQVIGALILVVINDAYSRPNAGYHYNNALRPQIQRLLIWPNSNYIRPSDGWRPMIPTSRSYQGGDFRYIPVQTRNILPTQRMEPVGWSQLNYNEMQFSQPRTRQLSYPDDVNYNSANHVHDNHYSGVGNSGGNYDQWDHRNMEYDKSEMNTRNMRLLQSQFQYLNYGLRGFQPTPPPPSTRENINCDCTRSQCSPIGSVESPRAREREKVIDLSDQKEPLVIKIMAHNDQREFGAVGSSPFSSLNGIDQELDSVSLSKIDDGSRNKIMPPSVDDTKKQEGIGTSVSENIDQDSGIDSRIDVIRELSGLSGKHIGKTEISVADETSKVHWMDSDPTRVLTDGKSSKSDDPKHQSDHDLDSSDEPYQQDSAAVVQLKQANIDEQFNLEALKPEKFHVNTANPTGSSLLHTEMRQTYGRDGQHTQIYQAQNPFFTYQQMFGIPTSYHLNSDKPPLMQSSLRAGEEKYQVFPDDSDPGKIFGQKLVKMNKTDGTKNKLKIQESSSAIGKKPDLRDDNPPFLNETVSASRDLLTSYVAERIKNNQNLNQKQTSGNKTSGHKVSKVTNKSCRPTLSSAYVSPPTTTVFTTTTTTQKTTVAPISHNVTNLILKPVANATAGENGVALASPVSHAYVQKGATVYIQYSPSSVAIAGSGGTALSKPQLIIKYLERK